MGTCQLSLYIVFSAFLSSHPPVRCDLDGLGPGPYYRAILRGGFVVGGSNTRGNYTEEIHPVPPPQTDPFTVAMDGIPSESSIVRAFANWSYLANEPYPEELAEITINNVSVAGILTGKAMDTLCWARTSRTIA